MTTPTDDQAFLNAAMQEAQGDERAENLVLLHYQQAIFQSIQQFHLSDDCASIDLTLLKQRAAKYATQTENYIETINVVPQATIKQLFDETRTLFRGIAELCPHCQKSLQQLILATFRTLQTH